jgi:hypothetical protein
VKLKPLAKAARHALFAQNDLWLISRALEEAIFHFADVLSEGGSRVAAGGQTTYFGSTMLSIDLGRLAVYGPGLRGDALHRALVQAVDGSVRVRLRAMRLGRAEAARRVHRRALDTALCEVRVSVSGKSLHIDVDLEAPVRVSSRASRPG